MRRWMVLFCLPLALLLTVCASERGAVGGDENSPPQGKKGEAFAPPWKAKDIADTIEDLSDPEWPVRVKAIRRVVDAGSWIVPFLMVALKNPEELNRQEVAYCLGRIGDGRAVLSLVEVLQEEPRYDVVVYTVEALGRLGDASAAEAVKTYLKYNLEREEYGREIGPIEIKAIESREGSVRQAAAEALAHLGDFDGMPLLIAGLTANGWLRRDAAVRLRRLTDCKVDFGFHLDMKVTEMDKVQAKWSAWWEENKAGFVPAKTEPREALDVYMPREKGEKK